MAVEVLQVLAVKELKIGNITLTDDSGNLVIKLPESSGTTQGFKIKDSQGFTVFAIDSSGNRYIKGYYRKV